MEKNKISGIVIAVVIILFVPSTSLASSTENENFGLNSLFMSAISNPFDYLKTDLFGEAADSQSIGTTVPTIPKLPGLKDFIVGSSETNGFGGLFDTDKLSRDDIGGSIKAVVVLAINLFLIIIQTVSGILKALLSLLS